MKKYFVGIRLKSVSNWFLVHSKEYDTKAQALKFLHKDLFYVDLSLGLKAYLCEHDLTTHKIKEKEVCVYEEKHCRNRK